MKKNVRKSVAKGNTSALVSIVKYIVSIPRSASDFIFTHLNAVGNLILVVSPVLMYYGGFTTSIQRAGNLSAVGGEVIAFVMLPVIAFSLKHYAKQLSLPDYLPTPNHRITRHTDDYGYEIYDDQIEELIAYTGELEDWLYENEYTNR